MEEEMDLESMKRRDLQRLCRKHEIPCNSTNSSMVESLRSIFQKQKNPKPKGCMKGSGGSSGEGLKKVTFVLEEEEEGVEVLEFGGQHGGRSSRRRYRVPDAPVRSTRSRGLAESVLWSPVIEKKKARVGKQAVCGNSEEEVLTKMRSLRNRVVEVGAEEQVVCGKRPRDVSEAVGQKKKLKKQAKDGEAVAQDVRRTTRSSSGLLEEVTSSDGETTLEEPSKGVKVNKLATKPVRRTRCSTSSSQEELYDCKTAAIDKHVKQVKTRGSEVVTEPFRRLTRSSVNLVGDEVGKLGGEAVRKGKSKRQAKAKVHVPRVGESAVPVSDTEALIPSTRRSTCSSSKLLDDDIPPLGVGKPWKQGKKHVSRSGDSEESASDSEAVISPTKRTTRTSSRLLEDEISLPAVGKPPQQAKKHVSRRDLEVTVSDTESVISPMRRTTRSSSVLLEDEKSLPECGKTQQQAKKHVLRRGQSNVSGSNSEAVISPTKRSTHSSSKMFADESSLLVVGKLGAEAVRNKSGKQAKKKGVSKASLSGSEAVNEPTRRTTRSSSLEDGASLPVHEKFNVDTEAVKKYKSGKQAKNHASNQGVPSALVLDSKFVAQSTRRPTRRSAHNSSMLGKPEVDNKAVRGDKPSKQSKKRASKRETSTALLVDSNSVAQPARRSSRSSPMHDSLGDGTYLPLRQKLDDDELEKQVRSLRSRKGDELKQENFLSLGGDSVNKAENGKRKKIQKQHGDQDLKGEASKAYVSDSKRGAELEGSEFPKNIEEPPKRTTRSASKHAESHIMPVGVTASDIVVETSSKKKRTRAGDLENVSVGMRETLELASLGILNAGSRKSSRKSLRNVPTESETVQRESSPETAVRWLEETVKASNVKFSTSGKQISSYKQLSSILETEDVQTLTSVEIHEKNDHNIVGGDKDKALELHEVMHTAENVTVPFSGQTPSIDLCVAGETDDAGNEVHDVSEKNVSELPSSPAPIKLLEAEQGTALEGSSNINQSSRVQEWHDERTSSVNHETEEHNILSGDVVEGSVSHEVVNGSDNVSLPESYSGARSVELFIAVETDGAEIEVNDVIERNYSQLQQSPVADQLQEVEKGILLDGPINSEQRRLKQELKVDGKVASSGNHDLEDHSIVGMDKTGVAEVHKVIPIVQIDANVVSEKSMPEVDRSPVSIQLQEVENILSFKGARNASTVDCHSYDPSVFSSGNHYKTVDGTSLVVDTDSGEIPILRRDLHIEKESSEADLDGKAEKVAKETPVVGSCSHISDDGVEEVKETCQSPTLFLAENDGEKAEAEVPPPSSQSDSSSFGLRLDEQVTDHGTHQAGIDCGSYKVSKETARDRDSLSSGAATAEAKGVCLIPVLPLLESDGAGTVGNQVNGEIGESSFHSEDVKSTAYSVISKGMGALTDAIPCGDNEKVVEAKNTPAVHLHNSGEGVAADFSSSIPMAGEVFSDQSRAVILAHFVNNNNSGDVTKVAIETEDVSLVGTTEASSLPYNEGYDAPSRTNVVEKVVHDYPSSARGPGGLDREAIMHSDQERNPGDMSPDLASANCEVVPQVTVGPTHELLDTNIKRNLGLTDIEHDSAVVDKFGETISGQGDASELQVALESSQEPKTSDFSSHGTFETPECQDSSPGERVLPVEDFSLSDKVENEHADKENAQGTSAEEKMLKEENNIEDDAITVKEDNISVDEFDEVHEQCVPSLHKVEVFFSDGHVGQENVENSSSVEVAFSEGHLSSPRPSANLGEGRDSATLRKEIFFLERPGSVEEPAGEMVVLSPKPVSKLDTEKAVQEKSETGILCNETGILCNAHAVEEQEDRLGVTRDADVDVSQTQAGSLSEASVNIEEPIFCSTSGSKYSKSVDTLQCEGTGVYETSTNLCLNSIEKAPHCTWQSLAVGEQEQITAGIEGDSSIKNESYTNYKGDSPMTGVNQYDTKIGIHEVEKLPPNSGESLVGNQDLTSRETKEVSAIEVGKASPRYVSVGTKELSAIEDERSSPASVPSLVGQQVQTSMDIQRFSATGTNDRVDKAPVVKDNMTLLFAPFQYNPREDASTGYTERSEDKLDSWVFGEMTDGMDLTEVSDELNYRSASQDEVGVLSKREGEFNRFEQSPVSRSVQPRAEEAGPSPMYLDDLFCMDDEGTDILNDSGHADQWEKRLDEEKSHFNEGENYLEVNSMKEAGERKEMKSMCFSRNFDAESKEALFFASESFAEAENVSASPVKEGKSSGQGG